MKPLNLTVDNFDSEAVNSDKPVLIDFYADWCGPCKMIAPILDELAKEVTHAKICKVDVDDQPQLATKFGVMSIPTVITLKGGHVYKKGVGFQTKEKLLELLD